MPWPSGHSYQRAARSAASRSRTRSATSCESHSKVFVVEQNRDAQLSTLLVNEAGINPASLISVLHYDGTPITARFITKEISEIVAALNVRPIKKDKAAETCCPRYCRRFRAFLSPPTSVPRQGRGLPRLPPSSLAGLPGRHELRCRRPAHAWRRAPPRELKRAAPDAQTRRRSTRFLDAQPQHRPAGPARATPSSPSATSTTASAERPLRLRVDGEDGAWRCSSASLFPKRRFLPLDDRAEQYVPELKGHPYGETTLRHLLTMSSGVEVRRGRDDGTRRAMRDPHRATPCAQQGQGGAESGHAFNAARAPGGHEVPLLLGRERGARPGAAQRRRRSRSPSTSPRRSGSRWAPRPTPPGCIDHGGYETGYCWHQRHAARLRALRHAARQLRRARRQADHPRRLGEGRHHRRGAAPRGRRRHADSTATATRPG